MSFAARLAPMPPAGLRMRPLTLRRLTAAERALGREVFGEGVTLERVRLLAVPLWPRAFVAGARLMVWPAAEAAVDFTLEPLWRQGVFVHELAHVWQAQRGVWLPLAKIKAGDSARAYAYDLDAGVEFHALNIEQQAMVVQHAFLSARGWSAPHPAELYARAAAQWRRA